MPSGAKKRKAAKKKKDHGGAAATDSSTNPLPSPTPSHESDGDEAPPTPRSHDGQRLIDGEGEEEKKEGALGLTPMEESSGNCSQGVGEPEKIEEGIEKGNPSGFEAAKCGENGREDSGEKETRGEVGEVVKDATEAEEIDLIEQVEEVPSPPSLPLLTSVGTEDVSVEFVEKVESTEISVAIAEDTKREVEAGMGAPTVPSEQRGIPPPAAGELSTATGKHEIPPTTEVSRTSLAQQHSYFWSCCGLLDVLTGSQR